MSMSGDDAYVLAMDYVDETLKGGGALKGDDGKSAYQSWLDLGNTGTEEDFINSLKGEGVDGFSPVITENSNNTDEDYRLDIETKESKFTTPNLKADIRKNIAEHNTSPDSHNDIRIFLNELNNRLNALANSDDETLDEMKEVVAYIKDNRSLIESITTTKVNVADIIDNLTTNVSNKPLSALQGVFIKNLIDVLQSELTAHTNNADIHVTASKKTEWDAATNKINNLKIADVNGLQTIADNNQYSFVYMKNGVGWYRFAEYTGDTSMVMGSTSNSCEITIKRAYTNENGEEHRLLLHSRYGVQNFENVSSFSAYHIITRIRYVYDTTGHAYIDVYYNSDMENGTSFILSNGKDLYGKWQAITPTFVAETVEGETVSTVFDIPANASPITTADSLMVKTIDVPTNYIYDVIGDKEGNIQYGEGVGVVNLRVDFFTTYEIEASKILAIYVEADKKLKGFVWDPLIESQVISGNTLYSFEIKDINSNSGSATITSCKLLYMV